MRRKPQRRRDEGKARFSRSGTRRNFDEEYKQSNGKEKGKRQMYKEEREREKPLGNAFLAHGLCGNMNTCG